MPLVEVCIVGDSPMTGYLGSILKKPDIVVWLATKKQKKIVSQIESALTGQISVDFESRDISEEGVEGFIQQCEKVIKDYPEHDVILNASGGTRLQSLIATEVFKRSNKEIIFVDIDNSCIVNVISGESTSFRLNLTVNEYIALHGYKMDSGTRFDPVIGKRSALSYFIGNNIDRVVPFIDKIRTEWDEMGEEKKDAQWRLDDEYLRFIINYEVGGDKIQCRFGVSDRQRTYEIQKDGLKYLFDGGWLRELVFLRVHRKPYDDIRLKVTLDPETLPDGSRSEDILDIAVVRDCKFSVFMCLPYPITKDTFIELRAIRSTIEPLNGRGFVFTAHRPHRGFFERSKDAGLEVVSGRRIGNFSL